MTKKRYHIAAIVSEFPMNATGKIRKRVLPDQAAKATA